MQACHQCISTNTDKHIKVIYPAGFKFPGDEKYSFGIHDSVKTFDVNTIKSNPISLVVAVHIYCNEQYADGYVFWLEANAPGNHNRKPGVRPGGTIAVKLFSELGNKLLPFILVDAKKRFSNH